MPTDDDDRADFKEVCPTCGKKIAQDERAGSLTSYLFQPFYCSCLSDADRLMPLAPAAKNERVSKGKVSLGKGKDSLGSFCPACGLQSVSQGPLGSITGFLFQDTRCKCQRDDVLLGDDMAERFFKLKEAEADKVFASVTVDVSKDDPSQKTAINLLPGAVIGGVYRIVRLVGKGGMGEVYLANHLSLGKVCALKLIPPHQVTDSSWKRFQNEAKTIASLDHINLVKVTDLGIHEGCLPYYAMEFLDGESLADWLKDRGPLPLKSVLEIYRQVCQGVDYAHRKGVVHRDLKPGNIMLMRTPSGGFAVKILDFGLVKLTQKDRQQQSLTRVGEVFGTPFYMSPEQCVGGKIDNRSDIYSIGCSMFETLTGQVPFSGKSPVETITAHQLYDPPTLESLAGANVFPVSMEVVLAKLLRKNPVERYQTLLELHQDLDKVEKGKEVEPYYVRRTKVPIIETQVMPSLPPAVYGEKNSKRRYTMLVAAVFLVTVIGLATITFVVTKEKEAPPVPEINANVKSLDINLQEPSPKKAEVVPASLTDMTPYSTIVTSEGHKLRCFHFPQDTTIGKVSSGSYNTREARGTVNFPFDEPITFMPEMAAIKYPSYLKRFRPGDINSLTMSKFVSAYTTNGSEICLLAMTSIPAVENVDLRNADEMSDKSVANLDKFTSMKVLSLGKAPLNPMVLARVSMIKKLDTLYLSGRYDARPVVMGLSGSKSMRKLSMPITVMDLDCISTLSNISSLEQLYFDQFLPNDLPTTVKALSLLSKNTHLQELSIRRLILRPETIAQLKTFKSLNLLRCDLIGSDYTGSLKRQLARDLPGVQLGPPYNNSGKLPRDSH